MTLNNWILCTSCGTPTETSIAGGIGNGSLTFKCPDCRNRVTHYIPSSTNYRPRIQWRMTFNLSWRSYPEVSPFLNRYTNCPECESDNAEVSAKLFDNGDVAAMGYCPDCENRQYAKLEM